MSKKARSADVVQHVHEVIEEMLAKFELKPSERLNEVELANRLKVSRTPIREALNRLSTMGLVTFVPNKGFYARGLEPEEMISLSELRAGVEGIAIQIACARASDEAIADLAKEWKSIVERQRTISSAELTLADEAFHEKLVGFAKNSELSAALRNVNVRIRFFRQCAIERKRCAGSTFRVGA